MPKHKFFSLKKVVPSLLLPQLVGWIGAFFTTPAIQAGWYAGLNKPTLIPPNWIFAPVWTTLYLLMGVSLYLILILKKKNKQLALSLFGAQLIFNLLWSVVFFGQNLLGWGLVVILILWSLIVANIIVFARLADNRLAKLAAALLLPYLLWTSFATWLNWQVWLLN